jgi:[acyl-carrier-protein] S-malonyltransferase
VRLKAPSVPVVANVLARPVSDPAEIARLLVEQVTGTVRWRETVEWLAANGVTVQCEVGSGKVLSGLARRIDRNLEILSVSSPDEVRQAAERLAAIGGNGAGGKGHV